MQNTRFWLPKGVSVLCRGRMRQDFREFIYRHLSVSFCLHLAIADEHAGLAQSVLAGVVRELSHGCCLERPASLMFQPRASLSTRPSAINLGLGF